MKLNTLNVCLGHLPFPTAFEGYVDLMVAPKLIPSARRLAIAEDERFGPHGHALSEYSQLFWIMERLAMIAPDAEYVRIFHYRRFVAATKPTVGERSSNIAWASTIRAESLDLFTDDFSRDVSGELFNTPVNFVDGVISQYASAHVLEDFLSFSRFLIEEKIFSADEVVRFVQEKRMIPSCNIGVFRKDTYVWTISILARAARFLHSPHFTLRSNYQRRSVGFLLERLHSYLIFKRIDAGASHPVFGHNVVLSDGAVVSATS